MTIGRQNLVLGGLLALAVGVYFFYTPSGEGSGPREKRSRFEDLRSDRLAEIEIQQKGQPPSRLDRATDLVGPYWRLAPPIDKPADPDLLQQMIFGLGQFTLAGGLEPGRAETSPSLTGLDNPRLVITLSWPQERHVLRFGKTPPTNSASVFYQCDDDPKVYLLDQKTFGAYNKSRTELRSKQLVRFLPQTAEKVEFSARFQVIRGDRGAKPTIEHEKSTFELQTQGTERGWFLTQPFSEKIDDLMLKRLLGDLSTLLTPDREDLVAPAAAGLEDPQIAVSIWLHGKDRPLQIRIGDLVGGKRFIHLEGSDEVGRLEAKWYDEIPHERNDFRSKTIFPFGKDVIRNFEVVTKEGPRVRIERRESKQPGSPLPVVTWEVVEPQGLKIEKEKVEPFVGDLLVQPIKTWSGKVAFNLAHLDPADATLTIETKDLTKHVFLFGITSNSAYLGRPGNPEVFEVEPQMVRRMLRLELSFLSDEIFNVPRENLRRFTYEGPNVIATGRSSYTLEFDDKAKAWKFTDEALKDKAPAEGWIDNLLSWLNYVKANGFIGRDAETILRYRLRDRYDAPAVLRIYYAGGPAEGLAFFISNDQSSNPNTSTYYARREDSPSVFQIHRDFVRMLQQVRFKSD